VHVVLFEIRTRPGIDTSAYEREFERMLALVSKVPGFLGIEGYAGENGTELAVARFDSEESIATWRDHADHAATRQRGREEFFDAYSITVAQITRSYRWSAETAVVATAPGAGDEATRR
jgi:heme-degrading monooxygenase HmoA